MGPSDPAQFKREIRGHLGRVILLAVLVGLNVGLTFLPLGSGVKVAGHVTLAALSAGVVLAFFMHLRSERRMTYAVLAGTFALLVALMVLTWAARHDQPALTEYIHASPTSAPPHVP